MSKSTGNSSKALLGLVVTIAMAEALMPPALAVTDTVLERQAGHLYRTGDLEAARNAYIDLVCQKPRSYRLRYELADICLRMHRYREAQLQYELCLELFPDIRTAAACKERIRYIKRYLNIPEELPDDRESDNFKALLSSQSVDRQEKAQQQLYLEKTRTLDRAWNNARDIKSRAETRIEEIRKDSAWWTIDREKNQLVPVVSPELENSIRAAAERQATKILDKGQASADELRLPDTDPVTEGLLSQMRSTGGGRNTRLSPLGSNIYVRNYFH